MKKDQKKYLRLKRMWVNFIIGLLIYCMTFLPGFLYFSKRNSFKGGSLVVILVLVLLTTAYWTSMIIIERRNEQRRN